MGPNPMEATNALAEFIPALESAEDAPPAAILRGTARGLEIVVDGSASTTAIISAVMKRLDDAPTFFRGSDVRIRVEDKPLAPGCLARLDEIAVMFELRIVEVTSVKRSATPAADADAVPVANLASGSAPSTPGAPSAAFEDEEPTSAGAKLAPLNHVAAETREPATLAAGELSGLVSVAEDAAATSFEEPTQTAVPMRLAATPEAELETRSRRARASSSARCARASSSSTPATSSCSATSTRAPRSAPRATSSCSVACAAPRTPASASDVGFILALRLEPQQLRIGRQVARAGDSDTPGASTEIAYVTRRTASSSSAITGKLPRSLATSI